MFIVLEAASYVLVNHTVPARIAARVGRGNLDFHLANRKRLQTHRLNPAPNPVGTYESPSVSVGEFKMFHPVLGWDYPPNSSYQGIDNIAYSHGPEGERRTCTSYPTTLIATYGDSFTYCANVRDEETWQTFLAHRLRSNILNFGVGGYGTDQAVLKYEHQNRNNTEIVMLCIWPENINRIANIYRPFYTYDDPLNLTKPLFVKGPDGCSLVSNPLKTRDDITKLVDPVFLGELAKLDYWYQFDKDLPSLSFPWTLSLFRWRKIVLKQLKLASPKALHRYFAPSYPANLYEEDGPFASMCHVVDRFIATARTRGSAPVIVIVPNKDFVREFTDHGVSRASRLVDYLSSRAYPHTDAIRAMAEMKPTGTQLEKWYCDHATAAGNQVLAGILSRYLADNFGKLVGPMFQESGGVAAPSEPLSPQGSATVDTIRFPVYE